ncbi:hypothetical protein GH714_030812 [Hevea brasiliensis]|uniref:Leucine-rich repeat-containing N-terminal plant-type domain-containing protein n=1 Tax=Hevea brasiliensis TaxID=3981 RepID=A0A6A6NK79_HEVBR|nr:hypothetical protein GH714_030812 [Hevea brasiliensis]
MLSSDISCLKSIRDSVEDPHNLLRSSWNFKNDSDGFICSFTGVERWHPNENRVLSLTLPKMELKCQCPRRIGNCTSLTGLDLSGNEFHGPKRIPLVTRLHISFNNFSGEIPSSTADCSLLNVLNLDHNRLIIIFHKKLVGSVGSKTFSVSHNLLSGPVPIFANATVSADAYANNNGLCGGPMKRCPESPRKFNWRFDYSFKGEGKKKVLNWPLRMKITTSIAKGLAWLHYCSSFCVAHLKISSKCVLFNKKFEPKLSNFGMSTFINSNEGELKQGFLNGC